MFSVHAVSWMNGSSAPESSRGTSAAIRRSRLRSLNAARISARRDQMRAPTNTRSTVPRNIAALIAQTIRLLSVEAIAVRAASQVKTDYNPPPPICERIRRAAESWQFPKQDSERQWRPQNGKAVCILRFGRRNHRCAKFQDLDRGTVEAAGGLLDFCGDGESRFLFPRAADDLHSDGQALGRGADRNDCSGSAEEIEPGRVGHRVEIFDFAPLNHPFTLAVAECGDRGHRAEQNRKFLHFGKEARPEHVAFEQGVQQFG